MRVKPVNGINELQRIILWRRVCTRVWHENPTPRTRHWLSAYLCDRTAANAHHSAAGRAAEVSIMKMIQVWQFITTLKGKPVLLVLKKKAKGKV